MAATAATSRRMSIRLSLAGCSPAVPASVSAARRIIESPEPAVKCSEFLCQDVAPTLGRGALARPRGEGPSQCCAKSSPPTRHPLYSSGWPSYSVLQPFDKLSAVGPGCGTNRRGTTYEGRAVFICVKTAGVRDHELEHLRSDGISPVRTRAASS